MKRQILAGLAVAGAMTLWVGSSAFASEDPAETLLQQAETYAAQASSAVTTCADAKIATLEATQVPNGVDPDAWENAVETATETVAGLADTAQSSIDAALENFNESVEAADENGTTLPTLDSFKAEINAIADPNNGGNPACAGIEAVTIVTPTTPAETENDNSQGDSKAGDKAND
jgi:hypothetical protein